MKKFKGDLVTSGVDYTTIKIGDHLKIGSVEFVISQIGKPCHQSECGIYKTGEVCILQKGIFFADVIESGEMKVSDKVYWA